METFSSTLLLPRSFVMMGIIDAFVYVHKYHRDNTDNPGKFEDCMEGRIRLPTAVTLSYVHAYQALCLTGRSADILPSAKAKYLNLPNDRKKKVTFLRDGRCSPMEGLTPLMVKLQPVGRRPLNRWKAPCHVWPGCSH